MKILQVCAALAAALSFIPVASQAGSYPDKPIRVILPAAAGGISDNITRLVTGAMQRELGQSLVVENLPGASGNIGTMKGLTAKPDGYTVTALSSVQAASMATRPGAADLFKLGEPVSLMSRSCLVMVVPSALGIKTMQEFIDYAKARPGKVFYGSPGIGSGHHITSAVINAAAGLEMVHVAYKGEQPATTDLLAGNIQVMLQSSPYPYIQSGQLTALAVTSAEPWPFAPDVPTLNSFLPGVSYYGWAGLYVPKGTPKEIIERLSKAADNALKSEKVREGFKSLGVVPVGGTPENFMKQLTSDIATFRDVVKKQNIVVAD